MIHGFVILGPKAGAEFIIVPLLLIGVPLGSFALTLVLHSLYRRRRSAWWFALGTILLAHFLGALWSGPSQDEVVILLLFGLPSTLGAVAAAFMRTGTCRSSGRRRAA